MNMGNKFNTTTIAVLGVAKGETSNEYVLVKNQSIYVTRYFHLTCL